MTMKCDLIIPIFCSIYLCHKRLDHISAGNRTPDYYISKRRITKNILIDAYFFGTKIVKRMYIFLPSLFVYHYNHELKCCQTFVMYPLLCVLYTHYEYICEFLTFDCTQVPLTRPITKGFTPKYATTFISIHCYEKRSVNSLLGCNIFAENMKSRFIAKTIRDIGNIIGMKKRKIVKITHTITNQNEHKTNNANHIA